MLEHRRRHCKALRLGTYRLILRIRSSKSIMGSVIDDVTKFDMYITNSAATTMMHASNKTTATIWNNNAMTNDNAMTDHRCLNWWAANSVSQSRDAIPSNGSFFWKGKRPRAQRCHRKWRSTNITKEHQVNVSKEHQRSLEATLGSERWSTT